MSTDQKSVTWYNDNAKSYTEHVRNPTDSLYHAYYEKPAMYDLVPDIVGKQVLSLGCGSGEDSCYLFSLGTKKSIGIDISRGMIDIAKAYTDCEFYIMDMEQLDFPDQSFGFVYSSLSLHYIEDWTRVFGEVFRVLEPDSYFLFSRIHPMRSTMVETKSDENGYEKHISMIKNKQNGTLQIIGDYLHKHVIDAVIGNTMTVTTWHKPLGTIIKTAQSSGFFIDSIIEPEPSPEMKNISLQTFERLSKIPEFIIFRLYKPAVSK